MGFAVINIENIQIEDDRQRKYFPEAEKEELIESIKSEIGLMTPILVRPRLDGRYSLVAGERRLRAITEMKCDYKFGDLEVPAGHIPAVVKYFDSDITVVEAELHENLRRLNLTWQEQAEAIARLHALKTSQNPKHNPGMTAMLVESAEHEGDYASPNTYRTVQASLLVSEYLDNPEVKSAKSLSKASKVVTRLLEEQQMERLRQIREKMAKEAVPETQEDDVEEFQVPILSSTYKTLGTLYEGDVKEELLRVPDGSVQIVITDPPYGMGVHKFDDGGNSTLAHEYSEDNFEELHEFLVKELDRVCSENAHVYIFCDIDYFHKLRSLFSEQWWVRRVPLIWDKGPSGKIADGLPNGYRRSHEYILHAKKGNRPCSKVMSDIISIPDERDKVHAAQKPVKLYEILLAMSAVPGDIVLDAFAGSGTIFRAAKTAMVVPIGIELNEKFANYCRTAQEYEDVVETPAGDFPLL